MAREARASGLPVAAHPAAEAPHRLEVLALPHLSARTTRLDVLAERRFVLERREEASALFRLQFQAEGRLLLLRHLLLDGVIREHVALDRLPQERLQEAHRIVDVAGRELAATQ